MYRAKDSLVFFLKKKNGRYYALAADHANLGVPLASMYRAKFSRVFFLFHYVQGLHYAYGTGSFKLSNYVNNMHRAVYPRVRLVIPSNYPQGSVFLSSASVFLSYC